MRVVESAAEEALNQLGGAAVCAAQWRIGLSQEEVQQNRHIVVAAVYYGHVSCSVTV